MTMTLQQAIVDEAFSWLGTPYHSHGRIKGVGVDCAMLLAEVYTRAEAIPPVDPGFYPEQFGLHRSEELFLSFVERHGVEVDEPQAGDCVLFKFGRCYSHGGIMVNERQLVHAVMRERKVGLADIEDAELVYRAPRFFRIVVS